MTKILDISRSEYAELCTVKKYTKPKIYPKVVTTKPMSAFTKVEKENIMKKYRRWYVSTATLIQMVVVRKLRPFSKPTSLS